MRVRYVYQDRESVFQTDKAELVVGRRGAGGEDVDLDLSPDQNVSRRHAKLRVEDGAVWVTDLGSTAGTWLGKEKLPPGLSTRLTGGEALRMGATALWPEPDDRPAAAPEAPTLSDTAVAESLPGVDDGRVTQAIDAGDVRVAAPAPAAAAATERPPQPQLSLSARRLALLHELPLRFGTQERLDGLLRAIVLGVVEAVDGTTYGALMLRDRGTDNLLLKVQHPPGPPMVSVTLARGAIGRKEAFIWERGREAGGPPGAHGTGGVVVSRSLADNPVQQVVCAPLLWDGEALGVLWLGSTLPDHRYTRDDLRLVAALAQHAAMALASQQLQDELRQNAKILKRLMTNFSPEVGEQLMERARRGSLRPGGTASVVTILCSDLRGFTRATQGMDAEEVVDLLNHYFSALVACVFRHRGTVDKFIGDAILAVFGSPAEDKQHQEHAVRAAADMQQAMAELNAARARAGQPVLELGVGIHCGRVLHGFIGSSDRLEFTVIGEAVNFASRYCDGAAGREVLLSPEVHAHVWNTARCAETTIRSKHEGELPAYRLLNLLP